MKLTEHFTLEEMLRSDTATKKGIENRKSEKWRPKKIGIFGVFGIIGVFEGRL
jgi:hypothetical protein